MNNKSISLTQIFAALSLVVCFLVFLLCAGCLLFVHVIDNLFGVVNEILEGGYNDHEFLVSKVLIGSYGMSCLGMFAASVGLILRQRWGRILALICLPLILLLSAYFSIHTLPLLFTKGNTLEAVWQMQYLLLLLPAVMVLYSLWGLVQVVLARSPGNAL